MVQKDSSLELSEEEESMRFGKMTTLNGAHTIQQFETTDADMEDLSEEDNVNVNMHWEVGVKT